MERARIAGRAIPALPAADFEESFAFYRKLGFDIDGPHDDYAVLCRNELEIHLYAKPGIECFTNNSACYLRVDDADAIHHELRLAGVIPLSDVEDKSWGMREFHVVDPSGNVIRIGQLIGGGSPQRAAMPAIGALIRRPPAEPAKWASPNEKIPPSDATSQ